MDNEGIKRLIFRIIEVAIYDVNGSGPYVYSNQNKDKDKNSAIRYLNSEDCRFACECLGVNHNCILDFLKRKDEKLKRTSNAYSREGRKA